MFRLALGLSLVGSLAVPVGAQQQQVDAKWLNFDPAAKTAKFHLIAGLTGLNGALNFNGFRDGGLTLVIPVGWTAEIAFKNHDGMLPHSAEVISPQTPLPTEPVSPGLPPQGTDVMRFAAQPAGEYLIFCGVPGHGAAGMWIRLRVSATTQTPALLLTPSTDAK